MIAVRPDGTEVKIETFQQKRHRCPSCRRSWSKARDARMHIENGCHKDPAIKSCGTCANYDYYPEEPDVGITSFSHGCSKDSDLFGVPVVVQGFVCKSGDPRDDFAVACPLWSAKTSASYDGKETGS